MIRYRYVEQLTPPAPFVSMSVRCPATGNRAADRAAQVDTAADRTVLPAELVEELGLVEDGRASFQGFAGEVVELPLFLVEVHVHDFAPLHLCTSVPFWASTNRTFCLVGTSSMPIAFNSMVQILSRRLSDRPAIDRRITD